MNQNKKILIIGGDATTLLNFRKELIIELVRKNYTVYCCASNYTSTQMQIIKEWDAIPIAHELNHKGMNLFDDFNIMLSLKKQIVDIKPNIVLSYFVKPVIFGTWAAKLAKVPKIIGMIEGLGNAFTPYQQGFTNKARIIQIAQIILYWCSVPLLNKLIVLNPDDKKDLIDKFHIPSKETIILGGIGVDLEKFTYQPISSTKTIRFIFIARLLQAKGIFEYLEAAKLVKEKYSNCEFVILGGFDENNPFALTKEQLQPFIDNRLVVHLGHVNNVAEEITKSSIFVQPSYYREGVPRSTQEAMAIGRPIITTDVAGCRETVINWKNGFLIPPYNANILAEKMIFFIDNPEQISIMGKESRKIAEEKFNVHIINHRLIDILEN